MPPAPKGHVELSQGGHGWVTFSLDGKYAWSHAPDVFDAKTKKLVATLKDENGKPVSGSKFIEVHFRDGKVVEMSNEFGLGRQVRSVRPTGLLKRRTPPGVPCWVFIRPNISVALSHGARVDHGPASKSSTDQ